MTMGTVLKGLLLAGFIGFLSVNAPSSAAPDENGTPTARAEATSAAARPLVGLALGGGGARGAAEVGVLKVLVDAGVPIDMIAGTSVGAVVGGLYAAGIPVCDLDRHFRDASLMRNFITVPLVVRILAEPVMFTPRLFGARPYDGLYRGRKFHKFTDTLARADRGRINIETFRIPFGAVCTDVVDGKSYAIRRGELGLAVQASTAVPGLCKPVQIGNHLYCDGGLVCNLPTRHVREMGANFVIAVNIDERLNPVPLDTFRAPGSMSRQAIRIQLNNEDIAAEKDANFVIHPYTNGITLVSRSKKDGVRGIAAGETAAREALPELKRRLQEIGITFTK